MKETENDINDEIKSESTELVKAGSEELAVKGDENTELEVSEAKITDLDTVAGTAVSASGSEAAPGLFKNKKFLIIGLASIAVILAVVLIIVFSGGKKDEKPQNNTLVELPTEAPTSTPVPTATPTPVPTATPTVIPVTEEPTPTQTVDEILLMHEAEGEMQSYINGNWVKKEIAMQRPYCMMFNNIAIANPQSGTSCADILYEILVEGNITRLMGVFENLTDESSCKDRMGSVRSARHYYASIASEYDAIFIHYGETTYATKKIKQLGLDHLEGTYAEGSTVFYRDKNIKAPHNAFATLSGIHKAIENKKFRTEHKEDFVPQHFDFAYPENGLNSIEQILEMPTQAECTTVYSEDGMTKYDDFTGTTCYDEDRILTATLVKIPFSSYAQPYLTYDEETKLYTRYQFNGEHIDYNTQEPLKFNNIIIQWVRESNRDKNGYQDIEGYGDRDGHHNPVEGGGYYICEGKCIEIYWNKDEANFECNYYTLDGDRLVLRPGKTFIALYPDTRIDKLEIN
ncbi:MAG: DUF3048 domain-containing protein [Lachnospiraceae bacterium]|nr:DUF3048 domain-containing protein [Lachnospiraceae bacterium]